LEINQGYTTMHGQTIIKILNRRIIFFVYSRVTAVKYRLDYRQFMTDLLMIFRSVSNLLVI